MKGCELYSNRVGWIVLSFLLLPFSFTFAQTDTTQHEQAYKPMEHLQPTQVYQGMILKLDILSTPLEIGLSRGLIQHYEIAMNWRLLNRLYPTFELGYAGGSTNRADSIAYRGHGGFFRVGLDINPLKKHPDSPHALLIGLRLGTAVQGVRQGLITDAGAPYSALSAQPLMVKADCWGEIVAGCQVAIYQGELKQGKNGKWQVPMAFYMGWMARFQCLFTRETANVAANERKPIYIPGFGQRDIISWGISYHLGWRF